MRTSKLYLVAGLLAFNSQTDRLNGCPHGNTKQEIVEKTIEKLEKKSQFSDEEKKQYVAMLFIYSGGKPFREEPFKTKWWYFPLFSRYYHHCNNQDAKFYHNLLNDPIKNSALNEYNYLSSIDGIRCYLQDKIDSEQKHSDLFRRSAEEKPETAQKCLEFAQIHEQEKTRLQALLAKLEKISQHNKQKDAQ